MKYRIDVVEHNGKTVFSCEGSKGPVLFDKLPAKSEFAGGCLEAFRGETSLGVIRSIAMVGRRVGFRKFQSLTGIFQSCVPAPKPRQILQNTSIGTGDLSAGDCLILEVPDGNFSIARFIPETWLTLGIQPQILSVKLGDLLTAEFNRINQLDGTPGKRAATVPEVLTFG